ncbi:P-type ATPase, partial [Treponema sp. R6D11]
IWEHSVGDAFVILAVFLLNSILGGIQEGKAQAALAAFKKMCAPLAVVKRDGGIKKNPASGVFVGGIVILEAGRQIPSVFLLMESANLKIEESALTGE